MGATIQPIAVVERVIDEYTRYLTTEFRARDPGLRRALEEALARPRFLAQEPFFQTHRPFQDGARWDALGLDPKLAAVLAGRTGSPYAFRHQSDAIAALRADPAESLVVTTGTGSGKSECFLLPVIQNAIEDAVRYRERGGLTAILVYPMNALANDQEARIQEYLKDSGHTYVRVARYDRSTRAEARAALRKHPPHILLTNYMMLEYLLVRPADREALFANHRCRYLVLDEVHTYRGSLGANIAMLVRRLRAHLALARHDDGPAHAADTKRFPSLAVVATSATIKSVDETGRSPEEVTRLREEAVRGFVSSLTGFDGARFRVLGETYRALEVPAEAAWPAEPVVCAPPPADDAAALQATVASLAGLAPDAPLDVSVRHAGILWTLQALLARRPMSVSQLVDAIRETVPARRDADPEAVAREVLCALTAGAQLGERPGALRLRAHRFIRGGWRFHRCIDPACGRLYPMGEESCACGRATAPLLLCRACGADALHFRGEADPTQGRLEPWNGPGEGPEWLLYRDAAEESDDDAPDEADEVSPRSAARGGSVRNKGVIVAGSFDPESGSFSADAKTYPVAVTLGGKRNRCLVCGRSAGSGRMLTGITLGTSAALRVLAEGVVESLAAQHKGHGKHDGKERLLIFSDSRQDAAHQARFITYAGRYDRMRRRVVAALPRTGEGVGLEALLRKLMQEGVARRDNPITATQQGAYLPRSVQDRALAWEEAPLLDDLAVSAAYRATLFNLGLVGVRYTPLAEAVTSHGVTLCAGLGLSAAQLVYLCRCVLDEMRTQQCLSRPMLQFHPDNPGCPDAFADAAWERRVTRPFGFACDAQGRPVESLDAATLPRGIGVYNLWRSGAGGTPRLQRVLRHLLLRMAGREATKDDALAVMGFLRDTGLVKAAALHGYKGTGHTLLQVEAEHIELVRLGDADRLRCGLCGAPACWVSEGTPCRICPGTLVRWDASEVARNRYVERILRAEELPLVAGEHTAQVTSEARNALEEDFKAGPERSPVNVLACSPTLEMGIDVGGLDAVLMRNVPPRPDNYAQRGGRAGRRSRVGVVVGYARNTPHDQYFYDRPAEMIAGEVAAPYVSLNNRDVLRRHLNAIVLGAAEPGLAGRMAEYIGWKGELKTEAIEALVESYRQHIGHGVEVARRALGDDVLGAVGLAEPEALRDELTQQPERIRALFDAVSFQVQRLRQHIESFSESGVARYQAWSASELIRRILGLPSEQGREGDADDRSEGHPMRRFAEFGILPGYEFPSEPATLRLRGDRHEAEPLSVVRRFGLGQYQPEAPVNARGHRWRVAGLDTSSPWNPKQDEASWRYRICGTCALRYSADEHVRCPRCGSSEAGGITLPAWAYGGFVAVRDDRPVLDDEERYGLASLVRCAPQWNGRVVASYRLPTGEVAELAHEEEIRWLNEGKRPLPNEMHAALHPEARGFLLCGGCGRMLQAQEPKRSKARGTKRAAEGGGEDVHNHAKNCPQRGREPKAIALTADGRATTLRLVVELPADTMPSDYESWGWSLGYALQTGLRQLYMLDGAEVEFELEPLWTVDDDAGRRKRGALTFIDPAVGGSGFLERAAAELHLVARSAIDHLRHEGCDRACYRCLKSYRNQRHHAQLSWPRAMETLEVLQTAPPVAVPVKRQHDPRPWLAAWAAGVGSPLELSFLRAFASKGLTLEKQYGIAAAPGEKAFTIADFALPAQRVAIYVDGRAFHVGSNVRRDQAIRARLRAMDPPWRVESLTVDDLRAGLPTLRDLFGDFGRMVWEEPASAPVLQAVTDAWDDTLSLLDKPWHALAEALRGLGVRAPDEVELELTHGRRVIDARAVMAWRVGGDAVVALVTEAVAGDARCVVATPESPAASVAAALAAEGVGA